MTRLEEFRCDPRRVAKIELCAVWGVGASTAEALVRQGVRGVADLRARVAAAAAVGAPPLVNPTVERTLLVYEDLRKKIPRQGVEAIRDAVLRVAGDLSKWRLLAFE